MSELNFFNGTGSVSEKIKENVYENNFVFRVPENMIVEQIYIPPSICPEVIENPSVNNVALPLGEYLDLVHCRVWRMAMESAGVSKWPNFHEGYRRYKSIIDGMSPGKELPEVESEENP